MLRFFLAVENWKKWGITCRIPQSSFLRTVVFLRLICWEKRGMEEYRICRIYRDVRALSIFAGTSEIMKLIISKNLGLSPL